MPMLRRIATPVATDAELAALTEVVLGAPGYSQQVEGRAPAAADVPALLADLPPGFTHEDKFFYGIWVNGRMVGCADVLRGWKHAGQSMIGLLLLREDAQGQGYGREACGLLEDIARNWPGMASMRVGVVSTNTGGLAFWRRMGYAETGERVKLPQYLGETIILEKPLR